MVEVHDDSAGGEADVPHWKFRTESFRDAPAMREQNIDGIEGATLAEAVRGHLLSEGHSCDEIFPEDFGWAFYAAGPEGRHFCAFTVQPWNQEAPEAARAMDAHASVHKQRSLVDRLLGHNREAPGEAVPMGVLNFLRAHPAVKDLREG
jgi:hypothetical protein